MAERDMLRWGGWGVSRKHHQLDLECFGVYVVVFLRVFLFQVYFEKLRRMSSVMAVMEPDGGPPRQRQ